MAVIVGDSIGEYVKLTVNKKIFNPLTAIESSMVRNSNDLGRVLGNLSRGNWRFIGERFDYFCDGKHIGNERLWAAVKLVFVAFCIALTILS